MYVRIKNCINKRKIEQAEYKVKACFQALLRRRRFSSVSSMSTCKTDPSVPGFASAKLHQIINEGKEKINEKPSLSSNNEGNE